MTVVGQRLYDRSVKHRRLVRAEQLSHGEEVDECRLLQLAKDGMAAINRRGDARTISMLGLHCFRQFRIVGLEFKFQRTPPDRELLLEQLKSRLLPSIERQFMMENVMQLGARWHWRWEQDATHEDTTYRRRKTSDQAKR